ncbi:MAG: methionine biosynthesis protein MetW [Halothiobacillus sp. 14-56-357]|jgi:methionine biosynthesis protein MetW|uniref:methionine biosynthesis protein MetW n=1 Tax=Halothiobacillus sp. 15-55-196 TaxID=1970382 RepID=UPI000BD62504|nr:methionine biosynthesis protein MetW [Halothiobacillus sp. 15-55-196]OZB35543.1 MAG: methionine biosynthesis protein MetW [Halothiobacillus sp. 15-55-196]OZB57035.1 MAG: methionine biosynthesis protein MetW [Halothiobacillus sp. 14-56-357]OZB78416.1 MAG: methionine biosynthesis protein MetW [Halothiobacillus sp. 13-55-115]
MIRPDWHIVGQWITPKSRVLDLGCGDGALLSHLIERRQVSAVGLELDDDKVASGIERGLNIIQEDLDSGISDWFAPMSFDFVIVSQTIQAMRHPERLLADMLTIAREGIVTFPNMGYWRNRVQLGLLGHMPINRALPNPWYNTPNIHLCTLSDFESLCHELGIQILDRAVVDSAHRESTLLRALPNWFGEHAIYRIQRKA